LERDKEWGIYSVTSKSPVSRLLCHTAHPIAAAQTRTTITPITLPSDFGAMRFKVLSDIFVGYNIEFNYFCPQIKDKDFFSTLASLKRIT